MVALTTIISIAVNVVASVAMSFIAKALRKKPKVDTDSLDFEQTVQRRLRNGQPLEVLVGKRITAGVGVFDDGYGPKNEFGIAVTVLSAKPCTQFHRLFVDGEPVDLSGDPTQGEVVVTSHFLGRKAAETINVFGTTFTVNEAEDIPRIAVRLFLGDDNSGLGNYLASKIPGKFTSADMGGDYCVLVTICQNTNDDFDEETGENYIPFQGYPEFKAELSGVKVCDPRSGGIYADETTYVYSDNAALIDAQYDYGWYDGEGAGRALIVGNGYPEGLMDLERIKANADYCDLENFGCSGIIRSGSNDQEEIWKCFNADRVEHPSSIYSVPEGNRTISETIDISLYPAAHISKYDEDGFSTEVYNEIQTVYAEPLEFYGEKDLEIYTRSEWVVDDNHIPRQMSLPLLYVTDKIQARKLEKQEIYISRTPATCTVADLPFGFIRIGVGDVITLTGSAISAINDRQWIVKGKGQSPMGDVSLMLRAYAEAEAFDFDPAIETPNIEIIQPIPREWPWWERLPYVNPGTVAGIQTNVTGIIDGTTELVDVRIVDRGLLTPELNIIGTDLNLVTTDVSGIKDGTLPLADVTLAGVGSLIDKDAAQDANIETAVTGGGNLSVTASPTFLYGSGTSVAAPVTTNSVTLTVNNGSGGETVAYVKVSGDTMTVDSSTSFTTSFTASPGLTGKNAVYKAVVTDGGNQAEVQMSIWIEYDDTNNGQ